ncbi:PH domain-containing protein [Cellulomonas fengjieae]|uniref:PH domain-containing protein n=1 Tax=Cellulomonas fengjieae TaxID=2819978 RepID=UPI001AAFBF11|nr:PH domain-containing protein [Cellulomonas fengjieae]MBO3102143.1 PH domain-containing protein [Cellulomonas fengjieae]
MSTPADDATPEATPVSDVPWERLDARIVLAAFLSGLVRLAPAAIAWWLFDQDDVAARVTVAALAAVALVHPANEALKFLKIRYRITPSELEVRKGLLVRSAHTVPLHRIRTVDITAPLLHRLLGLAVLTVGTGSNRMTDTSTGVSLGGLREPVAASLRSRLLRETRVPTDDPEPSAADDTAPADDTVAGLRWGWIVYAMSGLWLVLGSVSVGGTLFGMASLVGRADWLTGGVAAAWVALGTFAAAVALVVFLLVGALAGAVTFVTGWWGYRLVREPGGTFVATRGLLTTRSFTADPARMRGVTLTSSPIVRLLGGALARPVMTGVSLSQEMREAAALLPTTTREEAVRLADTLLGAPVLQPLEDGAVRLVTHPPAARRRAVARWLIADAVVAGLLALGVTLGGWSGWWLAVPVALLPLCVLAGRAAYRALGHALVDDRLYLQRGVVLRRTDALEVRGISGATVTQSPVQRWLGLAHLVATTAAGEQAYRAVDVAVGDATALAAALTAEPGIASPAPADARALGV